jgi:nucleotide-binding universal stress UspA family protein
MPELLVGKRLTLKNILFLTDFSEPSEAALLFAVALAKAYGAKLFAMHAIVPDATTYISPEMSATLIEAAEEGAKARMQRLDSQLKGLPHETILKRGIGVWAPLVETLEENNIDVIVAGTRGRTGAVKCLLGSVAEEIFRRARVPVITIGPGVRKQKPRFETVLFATDFSAESLSAAAYAISLAQETGAELLLLHVIGERENPRDGLSVAEALHRLLEIVPADAELRERPEPLVEHGERAERILAAAKRRGADLIVLGLRETEHLLAATHLEMSTAHKVVAHAGCPVMTVRKGPSTERLKV